MAQKSPYLKRQISSISISKILCIEKGDITDFGNALVEIASIILGRAVDERKFSKFTIDELNGIFAKADVDVLSLMLSCYFFGKDTFKIAKKNEMEREERELLETFAYRLLMLSKKDKAFIKDVLENEWIIPSSEFYAMKDAFGDDANNRFTSLVSSILTPSSLSLNLIQFGQRLPIDRECWFEGKAVFIRADIFDNIKFQVKNR